MSPHPKKLKTNQELHNLPHLQIFSSKTVLSKILNMYFGAEIFKDAFTAETA
jgi:hypothetical protein